MTRFNSKSQQLLDRIDKNDSINSLNEQVLKRGVLKGYKTIKKLNI